MLRILCLKARYNRFLDALRIEHQGYNINVTNILPVAITHRFTTNLSLNWGEAEGLLLLQRKFGDGCHFVCGGTRVRDYIVGDSGRLIDLVQRISPALVDALC